MPGATPGEAVLATRTDAAGGNTSSRAERPTGRIGGIDEWRGVLVLIVVAVHFLGFKSTGWTFRQPYTIAQDLRAEASPQIAFAGLLDFFVDLTGDTLPIQGWAVEGWDKTTGPGIAEVSVSVGDGPRMQALLGQPTPGLAQVHPSFASSGWVVQWNRSTAASGLVPVSVIVRTASGKEQEFRGSLDYRGRGTWPWDAAWVPVLAQMAIDHFFIVSGFLITMILVRTKGLPGYLWIFWARRMLRILPLALACTPALALIYPESRQHLWSYLFFYANYAAGGETVGALAPMWSLSVEEQFYLVFPVLFWLVPRERLWQLVAVLVMALAAIRLGLPSFHQYGLYVGTGYTHVRALSIALGSWVALVREGLVPSPRAMATVFVAWVATLIIAGGTDDLFTQPLARMGLLDPLGIVLGLVLLTWCVRRPPRPVAALRYFGVRCYGVYLLHLPMLMFVQAKAPKLPTHWFLVVFFVGLVAVVELSYRFFETPLLSLAPAYPARAPQQDSGPAPGKAEHEKPA